MSYNQQQLQFAARHIAATLRYANQDDHNISKLTHTHLLWAEYLLLNCLQPIQIHNPKNIVIKPTNVQLAAFFNSLIENKIQFPDNSTYVLKRSGQIFENKDSGSCKIYDRQKERAKHHSCHKQHLKNELTEQLQALDLEYDDDSYGSSSSEESGSSTFTPSYLIYMRQDMEPCTSYSTKASPSIKYLK